MRTIDFVPFLSATLILTAACGGEGTHDDNHDDPDASPTYYADVKPILDRKCAGCHYDGGIAPFSLTDYAGASGHAGVSKLAIESGIMPPWQAGDGCNDYQGDFSLSDDQKAMISAWVDAGAPEGDPAAEGEPLPEDRQGLSRVDLTMQMPEAYTPTVSPDDYRCFLMPWPAEYTDTRYVTGFGAAPGNDKTVHHVIAFLATPDQVATYQELDAAEDGPGYTCFGGTNGPARTWLGAWAPGGRGSDLPAGLGLAVEPGSMIILQVHYNVVAPDPGSDRTSIELKIDDQVDKVARIMPWANPGWLNSDSMMIPAGESDVMHTWQFDPTAFAGTQNLDIYTAALHMHTLGASGVLSVERADTTSECVLDIPRWDFDWQGSYGLSQPVRINRGDQLRIECHWNNSPENQPMVNGEPQIPRDVSWGEGTGDEMCLGVFLVAEGT